MTDGEFMYYLKSNHPYLYEIESRIREVSGRTGYGDISVNVTVRYSKVAMIDIGEFHKSKYVNDSDFKKLDK